MPKVVMSDQCYFCKIPLCEVCFRCEVSECPAYNKKVRDRVDAAFHNLLPVKTQKAIGYTALANIAKELHKSGLKIPLPYFVIQEEEDIYRISTAVGTNGYSEYFARPCPKTPRHGFVDSIKIDAYNSLGAITKLFYAARAADDEAELLLCPYTDADYNAVITPTKITIGTEHDGATAGNGTVEIPLLGVPFGGLDASIYEKSRIGEQDSPYFEAIHGSTVYDHYWYITQLRAGPKVEGLEYDFIPALMKVENTIEAAGDLLAWEEQVKNIAPGTVVVKLGGSLISHYGVHCIINNIPMMTSRQPMRGEWLASTVGSEDRKFNASKIKEGLAAAIGFPLSLENQDYKPNAEAIALIVVALHNAPVMTRSYGFWLGAAVGLMMRLGTAACHGEARHKDSSHLPRGVIYTEAFKDFFKARNLLRFCQEAFLYHKWSRGYGGSKWAKCGRSVITLDEAVRTFINDESPESIAALIEALNQAVNQAHNNGWWLNKFTDKSNLFNDAANQMLGPLLDAAKFGFELKAWWAGIHTQQLTVSSVINTYKEADPIFVSALLNTPLEDDPNEDEDEDDSSDDDPEPDIREEPEKKKGACTCAFCVNKGGQVDETFTSIEDMGVAEADVAATEATEPSISYPERVANLLLSDSITRTHVRFTKLTNLKVNAHIQIEFIRDTNTYYTSIDTNISLGTPLNNDAFCGKEKSYSSEKAGYCEAGYSFEPAQKRWLRIWAGDLMFHFNEERCLIRVARDTLSQSFQIN